MSDHDKPYHRFAKIYDRMGGDRFSEKMIPYTLKLLKKHKFKPESILDLCCGTGTAAVMLAKEGYEVSGLDGSEYMLKMANEKAAFKKLPVNFYHRHLPKFEIKTGKELKSFDLITCYYDSVNYLLTERDLALCFKSVARHLNDGGRFIFDMNTFHAFKHIWIKSNAGCYEEIAWIFESQINEKKKMAELTATFFIKKGKLWEKFSELHRERAYTITTLRKLLKNAGFIVDGIYNCFGVDRPDSKSNRIAVVARKK